MKAPKTWILIADGSHARVLNTTGHGHPFTQVPLLAMLPRRAIWVRTGRPERTNPWGRRGTRSSREPMHTARLKRSFAEEAADTPNDQLATGSFSTGSVSSSRPR